MTTVRVDDREPAGLIRTVRRHDDVEAVEVARLDAGDVVIGDVGIERKTPRDYVNGVMSRSGTDLEAQVETLAAAYDRGYVLLEGDLASFDDLRTGASGAAIRGSLASITARHGVPVIPCSDRTLLVDLAIRLGRKHVEEPSPRSLPPGAVAARNEPPAKRMYSCIDGIGPRLAETLHERYPTVADLLDADPADLTRIDGIGEKRARAIHAALREERD